MDCHRVAQISDAEIRRQELGGGEAGGRNQAIDVGKTKPGIGHGFAGSAKHELFGQRIGATEVIRLTHSDDGGSVLEAHRAPPCRRSGWQRGRVRILGETPATARGAIDIPRGIFLLF